MKNSIWNEKTAQALIETPFLFLTGGILYWVIEICYRGWSHWTMALCGAICFFAIYEINKRLSSKIFLLRAFLGASVIIFVELVAGIIFNLWLGWHIWDYSHLPLHLLGQICLPFFVLWFLLCIPAGLLCKWIRRFVFCERE